MEGVGDGAAVDGVDVVDGRDKLSAIGLVSPFAMAWEDDVSGRD